MQRAQNAAMASKRHCCRHVDRWHRPKGLRQRVFSRDTHARLACECSLSCVLGAPGTRHIHTPTPTQKKAPPPNGRPPKKREICGQVNGRCREKRTERAVARSVKRTGKRSVQGEADRKGNRLGGPLGGHAQRTAKQTGAHAQERAGRRGEHAGAAVMAGRTRGQTDTRAREHARTRGDAHTRCRTARVASLAPVTAERTRGPPGAGQADGRPGGQADGPADRQGDGRTRGFYYTSEQNSGPNRKSWFFPHGFGLLVKCSVLH